MTQGAFINECLIAKEGLRIALSARRLKRGYRQYSGDATSICAKIVKERWNGRYFETSSDHFKQYYSRDFGWCIGPLKKLGYDKEIKKTLHYALRCFKKHGRITTHIRPDGTPVDFPNYTPESLAYTLRSIHISGCKIDGYKSFLEKQIALAFTTFDTTTGLVRSDKNHSSLKDYSVRKSPIYTNIMLALIDRYADKLQLSNPFGRYDLQKAIMEKFWTGSYFLDDLSGRKHVAGDANVIPYWSGVFTSRKMFRSSLGMMQKEGLDKPFPLRYTKEKDHQFIRLHDLLMPNYEGNTIWTHIGSLFLETLDMMEDKHLERYMRQYKYLIEKYGNFLEVFEPDGKKPYTTWTYAADQSMLWASIFLSIQEGTQI